MKCKVKVGELRDALQMAAITVDRRQGSELGYVHLGSRKGKGGNQRIILNSTDGIGRFLIRVPCEVEETGDLVIEPIRLSSLLDKRQEDEVVVFAKDKTTNRVVARCGSAKVTMLSAGKSTAFESNIKDFPHTAEPTFQIEAVNLKSLLDRTQAFIFKKDGQEHLKNILIRTTKGGYETLATNREVVARAHAEDKNSPGLDGNGAQVTLVEIPGRALSPLARMLHRNKSGTIRVIVVKNPDGKPASVYFRTEDAFFGTNLTGNRLPAVDVVFQAPKMDTEVVVPRGELLDSITRSNPFCSESNAGRLVSLEVKESIVRLTAQDSFGEFEEEITVANPATGAGKGTFQVGHLTDIFRSSDDDNILLKLGTVGPSNRPSALLMSGDVIGACYVVAAIAVGVR